MAAALVCVAAPALASDKPPAPVVASQPDISWQDRLQHHTGQIALPAAHAKLNLGADYYFLDAAAAKRVLTEGWGNPPEVGEGVLGMIVPARFKPLEAASWGAVVTYQDVGYVSDKDARKIDPQKLLDQLRESEDESNARRKEAGYPTIHLAGWAEQPSYDPARHLVIWAQDLAIGGGEAHSLNYDIRLLNRQGVLSLNVISSMKDLQDVRAAAGSIAQAAVFDPGSTYADHAKGDKAAEFGVAGLVAAGLGLAAAKKFGLLAILLVVLKKGFVVVAAAFASVVAWVRKTFGGGKKKTVSADAAPPPSGPDLVS
ncbi:MAG: DUF2167 domain-containing protein [Caulobacter sp.]|nr:DUF2167 domain-containing protein [Caulobacter sp.]